MLDRSHRTRYCAIRSGRMNLCQCLITSSVPIVSSGVLVHSRWLSTIAHGFPRPSDQIWGMVWLGICTGIIWLPYKRTSRDPCKWKSPSEAFEDMSNIWIGSIGCMWLIYCRILPWINDIEKGRVVFIRSGVREWHTWGRCHFHCMYWMWGAKVTGAGSCAIMQQSPWQCMDSPALGVVLDSKLHSVREWGYKQIIQYFFSNNLSNGE